MNIELTEAVWFEESLEVSFEELAERSGLAEAKLRELVEYGALAPIDVHAPRWAFAPESINLARTACRLLNDFELDPGALAVALALLERVRELEAELQRLHAQFPAAFR